MQVKSIAECSKGSILQYFRPSLSYCLSLRSLFCLFSYGPFTEVLHVFYGVGADLKERAQMKQEDVGPFVAKLRGG